MTNQVGSKHEIHFTFEGIEFVFILKEHTKLVIAVDNKTVVMWDIVPDGCGIKPRSPKLIKCSSLPKEIEYFFVNSTFLSLEKQATKTLIDDIFAKAYQSIKQTPEFCIIENKIPRYE